MRVAIFVDLENFRQGIWNIDPKRELKYREMHFFLFNDIVKILNWEKYTPRLIRAYLYTGEYTDTLVKNIQHILDTYRLNFYQKRRLGVDVAKAVKRQEVQQKMFDWCTYCDFMELKTTPLKYKLDHGIFQKGVDVLIATDMISHAYQDNYDVAVLCSADLDLLESIKLVKSLGKKVILVAHREDTSKHIIRVSDYFYDIKNLATSQLDGISEIYERKNNTHSNILHSTVNSHSTAVTLETDKKTTNLTLETKKVESH